MKTDKTHDESAANEPHGKAELRAEAMHARAQLASTLDAIEYKLNVPKQLRITKRRIRLAMIRLGDDNPAALAGIALTAAVSVGTVVWLGARAVLTTRR
ncbi:DUF3618 domain-containing protein [Cryobacterium roopkundense]|uniref:DUF3618 domain-containing protein n=1 Tax=Cryobacterium roopkundense TaxID=1001240 RepID=A0A7W8ZZX7_9MICO|nr:DUF3618 domain-containing protein [Cryobacterium roopkundense]MBB5643309.1 hypothetical protein [Cryobacterium roopkundense]